MQQQPYFALVIMLTVPPHTLDRPSRCACIVDGATVAPVPICAQLRFMTPHATNWLLTRRSKPSHPIELATAAMTRCLLLCLLAIGLALPSPAKAAYSMQIIGSPFIGTPTTYVPIEVLVQTDKGCHPNLNPAPCAAPGVNVTFSITNGFGEVFDPLDAVIPAHSLSDKAAASLKSHATAKGKGEVSTPSVTVTVPTDQNGYAAVLAYSAVAGICDIRVMSPLIDGPQQLSAEWHDADYMVSLSSDSAVDAVSVELAQRGPGEVQLRCARYAGWYSLTLDAVQDSLWIVVVGRHQPGLHSCAISQCWGSGSSLRHRGVPVSIVQACWVAWWQQRPKAAEISVHGLQLINICACGGVLQQE